MCGASVVVAVPTTVAGRQVGEPGIGRDWVSPSKRFPYWSGTSRHPQEGSGRVGTIPNASKWNYWPAAALATPPILTAQSRMRTVSADSSGHWSVWIAKQPPGCSPNFSMAARRQLTRSIANLVATYLIKHGEMDPNLLFEPPLTDNAPGGPSQTPGSRTGS